METARAVSAADQELQTLRAQVLALSEAERASRTQLDALQAQLLALSQLALRRCLAVALQAARGYAVRARIDVELRPEAMPAARIVTEPRIAAAGCARILARPELSGTGTLSFVASLSRGAPPEPARHIYRPPEPEPDENGE